MKKRMMLIINPMAGRSGYKTGFGEVMNILDSGGVLHAGPRRRDRVCRAARGGV